MSRVLLDADLFSSIDLSKRTVIIDADTLLKLLKSCLERGTVNACTTDKGW